MVIGKKIIKVFIDSFSGIRTEVWWLSLVMLINRSGSMVFPFLSIYLINELGFDKIQASWVLTFFGIGSMIGALVGGWLTDRIGNFYVQFFSLTISGVGWLLLSFVTNYHALLIFVLIQSIIAESMRPANASSVTMFADKNNITKSYSLNRMSMNLGYSIGPALGGYFATISYLYLFIADGISCILAGIGFLWIFRKHFKWSPQKSIDNSTENISEIKPESEVEIQSVSPHKDGLFLVFIISTIMFAVVFFQLLFTLPIYYKEAYGLSEKMIGLILAFNGIIIFFSEMVFVHLIGNRIKKEVLILLGVVITGVSFVLLNFVTGFIWLLLGMAILSFGEIMSMPFMQTYVANKATSSNLGRYMAFYTFAYSTSLILAPYIGLRIIEYWGFSYLWYGCLILSILTCLLLIFVFNQEKKKSLITAVS